MKICTCCGQGRAIKKVRKLQGFGNYYYLDCCKDCLGWVRKQNAKTKTNN